MTKALPIGVTPLIRPEMAARAARDIPDGWYVNLGIGIPILISDHVPVEREVIFHSENGILGMGPAAVGNEVDPWVVNAAKKHVTLHPGGSFFNHSNSFAMIRGGHLDLCVMGALEVSQAGDLANWTTSANDAAPAVGGAMDLAVGAKQIWILMDHLTKDGISKLVRHCTYPVTALGTVSRVYTNLAVIDVTEQGFEVTEIVPGLSFEQLQALTDAPLHSSEK